MLVFKKAVFAALLAASFSACSTDDDASGRPIPDVSNEKIDLRVERFDQDLLSLDTTKLTEGLAFLEKKYPDFMPVLLGQILKNPRNPKEKPEETLGSLVRPVDFRRLRDSFQLAFGDFSTQKKELTRLFQFYKHYFPERPTPRILTVFTGYSYGAFPVNDSLFCIGLEFFLGENHLPYRLYLDLPEYVRARMNPNYLTAQTAEALALDAVGPSSGQRLLDEMMENGKAFYVKEALIPAAPDSITWGFRQAQLDWCRQNELEIWSFLLQEKLLFETNRKKFRKLVEESPNAGDSPPALREAPGRVGNWLGYRIVAAYMKRHPETTLRQLLDIHDAQKLLDGAKYKPRKK